MSKEWTLEDSIADIQRVAAEDEARERGEQLRDFATNLSRLIDRTFYGPGHAEIMVYAPPDVSDDGKSVEIPVLAGNSADDDYVITISRR